MFPKTPTLGSLRLARLSDVPRLGVVAASGFYHSTWFAYERPYANDWPKDTLASYRNMYQNLITDSDAVVLVAEDMLDVNERKHVFEGLAKVYPKWEDQIPPEHLKDGKSVVGVASLKLLPNSDRSGQFQPDGPPQKRPEDPDLRNRDRNAEANKLFDGIVSEAEERLFKGRLEVDTVVVHPAYWKKGHGSALVKWQLDLADMDQIGMGAATSAIGQLLFQHLGFTKADVVQVPGYKEHPEPLKVWLGLREADKDIKADL